MYYLLDLSRRRILMGDPSRDKVENYVCDETKLPKKELAVALATLGAIIVTDVAINKQQ